MIGSYLSKFLDLRSFFVMPNKILVVSDKPCYDAA
jgi:hypothetical protein